MKKGRPRKEIVRVQVAFKLAPEIKEKLFDLAEINGCTATKIIEDCLLSPITINNYGENERFVHVNP